MKAFYGIETHEVPASVATWDGTYVPFRMLSPTACEQYHVLMQHLRALNDEDADALRAAVLYVYEQLLLVGDFFPDRYQASSDLFPELVRQVRILLEELRSPRDNDPDAFRAAITRVAIAIHADMA